MITMDKLKLLLAGWRTSDQDPHRMYQVKYDATHYYSYKMEGSEQKRAFFNILAELPFDQRPTVFQYVSDQSCFFLQINLRPCAYHCQSEPLNRLDTRQILARCLSLITHGVMSSLLKMQRYYMASQYFDFYSLQKSHYQHLLIFPHIKMSMQDHTTLTAELIKLLNLDNDTIPWDQVIIQPTLWQRILLPYCKTDQPTTMVEQDLSWCQELKLENETCPSQPFYFFTLPPKADGPSHSSLLEFWMLSTVHN